MTHLALHNTLIPSLFDDAFFRPRVVRSHASSYRGRWRSAEEGWSFRLPLPGLAPSELALEVDEDGLHLERVQEGESSQENSGTSSQRLSFGWPGDVDLEAVEAKLEHGLLEVSAPRRQAPRRRIPLSPSLEAA